jgi:lipoprotein-anchoring transpeptidase ErfK/SrfK
VIVGLVAVGGLYAAGVGSGSGSGSGDEAGSGTGSTPPASSRSGPAVVARFTDAVEVFAEPTAADDPGEGEAEGRSEAVAPVHTLPATTEFGTPRALLVADQRDGWLEVELPVRPNGSTGWVRSEGAELREVEHEIVVDLTARTLTLTAGGEEVLSAPAAIGTSEFPTPPGRYYVTDKLATGEDGPYGPFALGLSAHSDVLTEFAGGDGQVGIHGTNDPATIGQAVSHGCVRVTNDVITRLEELVSLGTPVTIT